MELFISEETCITETVTCRETSSHGANFRTSEIITEDVLNYFDLYVSSVCGALLSILGVVTNVLNVIVYWKQLTGDAVNITFLALSVWDLNNCFLSILSMICFVIETYFPMPAVNMMSLQYVFLGYTKGFMYIMSTVVTVYLSAERCICIMFPFKVKGMFTKTRVILANLIIVCTGSACFCPAWATQELRWVFNPVNNKTRLDLWLSLNRREIDIFVDTCNGIVIPFVAQVLITVSAVFMVQGIHTSAKFRQQATKAEKTGATSSCRTASISKTTSAPKASSTTTFMTNRDIKLTMVVVLLAIIFFICNFPVFVVAFIRALIPDMDVGKLQYNLYRVLYTTVYHCGLINCSVNIIVYYYASARYRRVFLTLIGREESTRKHQ